MSFSYLEKMNGIELKVLVDQKVEKMNGKELKVLVDQKVVQLDYFHHKVAQSEDR